MPARRLPREDLPPLTAAVGVDLGGTWLRACAVDKHGRVLRRVRRPAVPPARAPRALAALWRAWRLDRRTALVLGSKGLWRPAARAPLIPRLARLSDRVRVLSDVELAYFAALGEAPGVLVLAGTGSIALARDVHGRWHRAGGLGPAAGDEGSAFWIGKEFRRRFAGRNTPLTPAGVRRAAADARRAWLRRKEPPVDALIDEAAGHLARIAQAAAVAAGLRRPWRAGWWGGLMGEAGFRRRVFRRLGAAKVHAPRRDAEWTAARMGVIYGAKEAHL